MRRIVVPIWSAALVWFALLWSVPAAAQCLDFKSADIPDGFPITTPQMMAFSDAALSIYIMGNINGIMHSIALGADPACVEQLTLCITGKSGGDLVDAVRSYVLARPDMAGEPSAQMVFNAVFGPCFTELVPRPRGMPT